MILLSRQVAFLTDYRIRIVYAVALLGVVFLVRKLLNFLPWEIAHLGIHWAYYYRRLELELPFWIWIWIPLILSQMLAIGYVLRIMVKPTTRRFMSNGREPD